MDTKLLQSGHQYLQKRILVSKAPGRLDCGGTWDLTPLALSHRLYKPVTVNLAISKYAKVTVQESEKGVVSVNSYDFGTATSAPGQFSYNTPLGPIFYLCTLFGLTGIEIHVETEFPGRSGLGGSAAIIVATIAALDKIRPLQSAPLNKTQIALLANRVESSISFCGLQDHVAASFGGVNAWYWRYYLFDKPYRKCSLLDNYRMSDLSRAIAVAFTGDSHDSTISTNSWVQGFIAASSREEWLRCNQTARKFAWALSRLDYTAAARWLNEETSIRNRVCPEAMTDKMWYLGKIAIDLECGLRFTGAGNGGCVWAIGNPTAIVELKGKWNAASNHMAKAELIECSIDTSGVTVEWKN